MLPGIEYLTHLNLEGQAPDRGYKLAQSTANDIARASHGVVADPQEDSFRVPSGVKRFAAPKAAEVFDIIALTWWFLESPLPTREGFASFVELLESTLPEALPKRYGQYEPPQHRYDQTGKAHFLQFVHDEAYTVTVWYPSRPFVGVYLSTPNPMGAFQLGFRTGQLVIEIEKSAWTQPGWSTNLRRFWMKASALIQPIYGEVRVLGRYSRHGASVFTQQGYRDRPVKSWWWNGIPKILGAAVVLGADYQRLWPQFIAAASTIDGLAFASLDDWTSLSDLTETVGPPPGDQTQRTSDFPKDEQSYPSGWPFGPKFLPKIPLAPSLLPRRNTTRSTRGFVGKLLSRLRRPRS